MIDFYNTILTNLILYARTNLRAKGAQPLLKRSSKIHPKIASKIQSKISKIKI